MRPSSCARPSSASTCGSRGARPRGPAARAAPRRRRGGTLDAAQPHAAAVVGVHAQHAAALARLELEVPDVVDGGDVVAAELAHGDVGVAHDDPAGPEQVRTTATETTAVTTCRPRRRCTAGRGRQQRDRRQLVTASATGTPARATPGSGRRAPSRSAGRAGSADRRSARAAARWVGPRSTWRGAGGSAGRGRHGGGHAGPPEQGRCPVLVRTTLHRSTGCANVSRRADRGRVRHPRRADAADPRRQVLHLGEAEPRQQPPGRLVARSALGDQAAHARLHVRPGAQHGDRLGAEPCPRYGAARP